jgi:hypothetical protein
MPRLALSHYIVWITAEGCGGGGGSSSSKVVPVLNYIPYHEYVSIA